MRAGIFVLGFAAVLGALAVWLIPTPSDTTTTRERSTTAATNSAGEKDTTTIDKTTMTRAPGAGRSDTVVVALLTLGGGLLLAASFWDRIQSLAIAGVSITLSDAAVPAPGIALVDTAAAHLNSPTSTAVDDDIVPQVKSVAKDKLRLVRVDLRNGDVWASLNLRLFVLLLAGRTNAEVIVFTGQDKAGPDTYFGAASAADLADKFAADDPELAAAYRATERTPLDRSELNAGEPSIGRRFFDELQGLNPSRIEGAEAGERVDLKKLHELADGELTEKFVPSEGQRILSNRQQRLILAFPLPYVPITDRGRLDEIVDRSRLAEKIARSTVGA